MSLYENVNQRRRQGKRPKRPGEKGYPTADSWIRAAETEKKKKKKKKTKTRNK